MHFRLDATEVSTEADSANDQTLTPSAAGGTTTTAASSLGVARVPPASPAKVGQRIELCVDPARVQYFDIATGGAIRGSKVHGHESRPAG